MSFICPYANLPLEKDRPCEVDSCGFNILSHAKGTYGEKIARTYLGCFLNYVKATQWNPFKVAALGEFSTLSLPLREHLASLFLGMKEEEVIKAKRTFYFSLFSLLSEESASAASVPKRQHAPVPYRQCAVCGNSDVPLWFPKSGLLPNGYGYCSWACWQTLPPPLLSLEHATASGIPFSDMTQTVTFQGNHSRLQYVKHLVFNILGDTGMN